LAAPFLILTYGNVLNLLLSGVNDRASGWGWEHNDSDRDMTLGHLANMASGYATPQAPGRARNSRQRPTNAHGRRPLRLRLLAPSVPAGVAIA